MDLKLIDNKGNNTLENLIHKKVTQHSQISIQTASFSIYAFHALQKEIKRSKKLRLILTKSFFEKEETGFLKRYEIAQSREKISGNKYEIKLRNKMNTAFIARETSKLIKEKVKVRQLDQDQNALNELLIENGDNSFGNLVVPAMFKFTSDGLGITESNNVSSMTAIDNADPNYFNGVKSNFDNLWNDSRKTKEVTKKVLEKVRTIYQENSPEWIYLVSLYHIFHDKLNEMDENEVVSRDTGFKDSVIWNKLYQFQKDGVLGLIRKLQKYNGAILADSVGLGKTYSALAVIKYFELQRKRVLVLAPKRLHDNWALYTRPDVRNVLLKDNFNYTVLNHTDLSRYKGESNGIKLDTFLWSDFDLVVIDESHNFRNNDTSVNRQTKTRYQRLMEDIIQSGRKTKVLMLSATPINNRMSDLKNQIGFITESKADALSKYGIENIDNTLRLAQRAFNQWMELDEKERTTQRFLEMVNPDYFKLLDMLTIARSRKHIEKYYGTSLSNFPKRLKPITVKPDIDTSGKFPNLKDVYDSIGSLNLAMYQPMQYVLLNKIKHYEELYDTKVKGGKSSFRQTDREKALSSLIRANLFKRLESSINSFGLTLERMINEIEKSLSEIKEQKSKNIKLPSITDFDDEDLESTFEENAVGTKTKILIGDMDLIKWSQALIEDLATLKKLKADTEMVSPEKDAKLIELEKILRNKYENPINDDNKKVIIFTAFSDTANYLYNNLVDVVKEKYGLNTALVTGGSTQNKTNMKNVALNDSSDILINFSPISKGRDHIEPEAREEIDLLIATDAISEGQNLQDADYVINYDIHWNPVRVIQRFGRIDRIGSKNKRIQLVNFWPNVDLDTYLNLEQRVKGRMVMLNTAATGEDDLLNSPSNKEMNDLKYRKKQLEQLQKQVIDLEDVNGAISITDMTFNDFKVDLQNALKDHEKLLNEAPLGMYAVSSIKDCPEAEPGIILTLKNHNGDIDNKNGISPYIVIYMRMDGTVKINYTHAKEVLELYKKLTLGKTEVNQDLVNEFYVETNDGENMSTYSEILSKAIEVIRNKHDEIGLNSLFSPGGTSIQTNLVENLDDIELISFLIIK